jgi:hypothetical protein
MTDRDAGLETVRRLREAMARRQGPHGTPPDVRCRWCGSQRHYSPACPERER